MSDLNVSLDDLPPEKRKEIEDAIGTPITSHTGQMRIVGIATLRAILNPHAPFGTKADIFNRYAMLICADAVLEAIYEISQTLAAYPKEQHPILTTITLRTLAEVSADKATEDFRILRNLLLHALELKGKDNSNEPC